MSAMDIAESLMLVVVVGGGVVLWWGRGWTNRGGDGLAHDYT